MNRYSCLLKQGCSFMSTVSDKLRTHIVITHTKKEVYDFAERLGYLHKSDYNALLWVIVERESCAIMTRGGVAF